MTSGEKRLCEWQLGKLGRIGGFWSSQFNAMAQADTPMRERLKRVFPSEVAAMERFLFEEGCWTALKSEYEEEVHDV